MICVLFCFFGEENYQRFIWDVVNVNYIGWHMYTRPSNWLEYNWCLFFYRLWLGPWRVSQNQGHLVLFLILQLYVSFSCLVILYRKRACSKNIDMICLGRNRAIVQRGIYGYLVSANALLFDFFLFCFVHCKEYPKHCVPMLNQHILLWQAALMVKCFLFAYSLCLWSLSDYYAQ